ncbi:MULTISPECIES: hypothetical protein [Aliivibrio]|uniref:Uncharacterized protein n=1 Tax=Aliivibrio finisterrensis TaxID=511998 RepID=A0A4Q5KJT1_9GAMM|nr:MULTISPECIES: hypothetical protein [Aliivibrio]MDD9180746.1 hypothetical protein [Aliivibrio sp. A6]RYU46509.1 hypothetical protein ERW57_19200 [Aliivibrio finisterrensis]RYU47074.1 hypothetical protein ERW56_19435 [Aliivibrio finisterrensis]RYU51504.1 hypothetical protein ERW50_19500 [Aliivibrio finisterrensis]RYU59884.1 hypothetical protein ERW53_19725 [Aliivibrio finisterrensis]
MTRYHNIDLLLDNGFKQFKNTTVFSSGHVSLISPSVAKNNTGSYWFDVRKVNLNRLGEAPFILVRIVPDLFIFEPLASIDTLLAEEYMDNRPHSGDVWGIKMELDLVSMQAIVFNVKASNYELKLNIQSLVDIQAKLVTLG